LTLFINIFAYKRKFFIF